MKAERPLITAPGRIEWSPAQLPDRVPPGMVRVRTLFSLISPGTELRLYLGKPMAEEVWEGFAEIDVVTSTGMGTLPAYAVTGANRPGEARFPVNFGYNSLGVVTDVGEGVEGLSPGERVFALARHQEAYDVLEWQAAPVPEAVSDQAAPFAYLPTLGLHALRRGGFIPGHNAAVIGLGLVGLGAALAADAVGARLVCLDISPARRERAAAALPDALALDPRREDLADRLTERFHPFGVDIAVEAAVGAEALDLGMRILDEGGRLVAIALHPEEVGSLLSSDFYSKQVSILGTSNAPYRDPARRESRFTIADNVSFLLRLCARGRLDLSALRTHVYPASRAGEAMADLAAGEQDMLGTLLDWR